MLGHGRARGGGEECSFFKKRTKKLLFQGCAFPAERRDSGPKSFLLLFFKQEALPRPTRLDLHQSPRPASPRMVRRGER
jgi:hypothetical protein